MVINGPLIQPEGVFVNVPAKVLDRDVVVDALESALEDGSHGFDAVGMHVPVYVLAFGVAHGVVIITFKVESVVAPVLVRVDGGVFFDVLEDDVLNRTLVRHFDRHGDHLVVALAHTEHGSLALSAPTLHLLIVVLVALLPAVATCSSKWSTGLSKPLRTGTLEC